MKKETLYGITVLVISAGLTISSLAGCAASGALSAPENIIADPVSTRNVPEETTALENTAAAVQDTVTAVQDTTADAAVTAVEKTAEPEKTALPPEKPSEGKLIGLISEYLTSEKPVESIPKIKDCLEQLEDLPGVVEKNPFYWYVKGLVGEYEGDFEAAAGFMGKAAGIAPNNRDIGLWQEAFKEKDRAAAGRSIKPGSVEPALDGGSFNFNDGTLWVDEHNVLVTIEKGSGAEARQYLMLMNAGTLQSRQVYEGSRILLDSVTPDGKHAVVYDGGLKLVSLETGGVVLVSDKGTDAVLSPDGKKLAYCAAGLWVYEIETGGNTRLDDGAYDASPIWFPEGKALLFIGDPGEEKPGDGAGRLLAIFRLPVEPAGKKERVDESWKEKFRNIKWILQGEIFQADADGDNGSNSTAYYLYTDYKNRIDGADNGRYPIYRQDSPGYLYFADGKGGVTLMDLDGIIRGRVEYGNIWGSDFGIPLKGLEAPQGSNGLLLYYRTPLETMLRVYSMDAELGNPHLVAEIPADSPLKAAVNGTASQALFSVGADELLLVDLKPPVTVNSPQPTHS